MSIIDIPDISVSAGLELDIDTADEKALKQLRQAALIQRYAPRFIKYPVGINVLANNTSFQFVTDSPAEMRRLDLRRFHLDVAQPLSATGSVIQPPGATTISANQTGTGAASAITLTVPAVAGQTNQVSSFTVSGTGATSGSTITITLAGIQGGTQSFPYVVPTGAGVAAPTLEVNFNPPLVATGPNVAIVLTVPSFGVGNLSSAAELEAQSIQGGLTIYLVSDPGNAAANPNQYLHSVGVIARFTSLPIDIRWSSHEATVFHPENVWIVVANASNVALNLSGNLQTTDMASDEFSEPTMVYDILSTFNPNL